MKEELNIYNVYTLFYVVIQYGLVNTALYTGVQKVLKYFNITKNINFLKNIIQR